MVWPYNLKRLFSRSGDGVVKLGDVTWPRYLLIYPETEERWQQVLDWPIRHPGTLWLVLVLDQILATFWAVVCNSIHLQASIPAFAMPEAEDQFRIWPSPLIPQSTPRPNVWFCSTVRYLTPLAQHPRRQHLICLGPDSCRAPTT
jgi:hypothetical protein